MNTQLNNNAYQTPYIPYTSPVTTPQYTPQPQQTNNITWVQGIEGARAYNVGPNSAVSLWDSESNTIYLKMTDASGIPQPIRIFDYTERAENKEETKNYVTADELEGILDRKLSEFANNFNRPYQKKGGKYNGKPTVQPSES